MAVGAEEEFDVLHGGDEPVQAFLLVGEEGLGGNHEFPAAVPDAAADETRVGELRRGAAVEEGGVGDEAEGLVLADDPGPLAEGAVGGEELGAVEGGVPQVVRQRQGLVMVDASEGEQAGCLEQRCAMAPRWSCMAEGEAGWF